MRPPSLAAYPLNDLPLLRITDPCGVEPIGQLIGGPCGVMPDEVAVKCSGTPVRSHWVMNHLRVEWNTVP